MNNGMKNVMHMIILAAEVALLWTLMSFEWFLNSPNGRDVRYHTWETLISTAVGFGIIASSVVFMVLKRRSRKDCPSSGHLLLFLTAGIFCLVFGLYLTAVEYGDRFRLSNVKMADDRLRDMDAVIVRFDPAGGDLADVCRCVKRGETYGGAVNLYPSDDLRCFQDILHCALNPPRGQFVVCARNLTRDNFCVNYFTTNVLSDAFSGSLMTYVVDVDHFEGEISRWIVGQTLSTNHNVYAQLSAGSVGGQLKSGERRFLQLKMNEWGRENSMMDRAYLCLRPGQGVDMSFRTAVFVGSGIDETTYRYVDPGEVVSCALPIPTRPGFVFRGWFDGQRRITECSRVERRDAHILRAVWEKPSPVR